ncbi:MAG: hypothetical protein K2M79_07260 [Muribaculaceae bacterium]|nr:hypothetical protein [Muribaculaceae bacterium]
MMKTVFKNAVSGLWPSVKSLGKILFQSRKCVFTARAEAEKIIIMGNGPSLRRFIVNNAEMLASIPSMAVNFAANAPEFISLRPEYYLMADPHFFTGADDPNVKRLYERLVEIDWPLTVFVPVKYYSVTRERLRANTLITVNSFNFVGIEGWDWLKDMAYRSGTGMPRPRNVLIPSIMTAVRMGFKEIILVGADHSWTQTLSVDEANRVVSVQPHFYKDNNAEKERVSSVYSNIKLHELLLSFHIAFKSYWEVRRYADKIGIQIKNATPGSFIDAFERAQL